MFTQWKWYWWNHEKPNILYPSATGEFARILSLVTCLLLGSSALLSLIPRSLNIDNFSWPRTDLKWLPSPWIVDPNWPAVEWPLLLLTTGCPGSWWSSANTSIFHSNRRLVHQKLQKKTRPLGSPFPQHESWLTNLWVGNLQECCGCQNISNYIINKLIHTFSSHFVNSHFCMFKFECCGRCRHNWLKSSTSVKYVD